MEPQLQSLPRLRPQLTSPQPQRQLLPLLQMQKWPRLRRQNQKQSQSPPR